MYNYIIGEIKYFFFAKQGKNATIKWTIGRTKETSDIKILQQKCCHIMTEAHIHSSSGRAVLFRF